MKAQPRLFIIVSLIVLIGGCRGEGFKPLTQGSLVNPTATGMFPETDKLDPECRTSREYEACLILKNPVSQSGAPLSSASALEIDRLQTFGVHLTGLDGSGALSNPNFSVTTIHSSRLDLSVPARLKGLYSQNSASGGTDLLQMMTYYYFNRAILFWSSRGPLALRGQRLKVVVDDNLTGWNSRAKTIHLLARNGSWPMALDTSQSLLILGLANVHLASRGAINRFPASDTRHVRCGSDAKGCCQSEIGCARALASGAATYFVAAMFPSAPAIGELKSNRLEGISACEKAVRNVDLNGQLSKAAAFSACSSRPGDVHVLGTLYASIWWRIRQGAGEESALIDNLYLRHLSLLQSTDTFTSARDKILSLESSLLGGRFHDAIQAEFQRRGF